MKHLIFTSSGLPYSVVCPQQLKSPNEAFTMDFSLQNDGTPNAIKTKKL
jgi:hypothetical protein